MTINGYVKHLLQIFIIVFSLFVLAAPMADASIVENCSEKILDMQDQEFDEDLEDNLEEKIIFDTFLSYIFNPFSTSQPSYQLYLHTHKNNYSLYKPPISHT